MGNTIIPFGKKYYEHGVHEDLFEQSLAIGGYESGWLLDLIASYILDKAQDRFANTHFCGMYRDDGIVAFQGSQNHNHVLLPFKPM